jgi:hypothetical protein
MTDSLAAFHLSPSEEEEQIKHLGDEEVEMLREALKQVHADGYIVFGPSVPAKRLAHFKVETLPNEYEMLLDPNYLEGLEAGFYPPPQEQVYFIVDEKGQPLPPYPAFPDEQTAIMVALQAGIITPEMLQMANDYQVAVSMQPEMAEQMPQPPQIPVMPFVNFWFGLLGLPSFDNGKDSPFHWEQRDLINLTNTLIKRMQTQMMQMGMMAGGI